MVPTTVKDVERNVKLWESFASDRSAENRNRIAEVYYQECRKVAAGIWSRYLKGKFRFVLADWTSECTLKLLYIIEKFDHTQNDNFNGYMYLCLRREFNRWVKKSRLDETSRYAETCENSFPVEYAEDYSEETEKKLRCILGDDYIDSRLRGEKPTLDAGQRYQLQYAKRLVA